MLPGFRLIAVSFLCGFAVMFAGLRVVASLNNIHEGLPIPAAQAATVPQPGMIEPRGTSLAMPVLYDLRFVGSPSAPLLVNVTPQAIERMLPIEAAPKPAPEAVAVVSPPTEPPLAPAAAEPAVESAASEPHAALSLQPITEPSAPVEANTPTVIAVIASDPDPAAAPAVEAPKPPETRAAQRAAAKAARKKRVRLAHRRAPAAIGNPSNNSLGIR